MANIRLADDVTTKTYRYGHKFLIDIQKIESANRWIAYIYNYNHTIKLVLCERFISSTTEHEFLELCYSLAAEESEIYRKDIMEEF